jgi:hypothetical protein
MTEAALSDLAHRALIAIRAQDKEGFVVATDSLVGLLGLAELAIAVEAAEELRGAYLIDIEDGAPIESAQLLINASGRVVADILPFSAGGFDF